MSDVSVLDLPAREFSLDQPLLIKLDKETKRLARQLDRASVRKLISTYYVWQEHRIALNGQVRAIEAGEGEARSAEIMKYFANQVGALEKVVPAALDEWVSARPVGQWARAVHGIGPILAAGLSAHIDINKAPAVTNVYSFMGYNPLMEWKKGQKRPYNHDLKVVGWRIGDSFTKFRNNPSSYYGRLLTIRKAHQINQNEAGAYAELAAKTLQERNFQDKATKAVYEAGRLPRGRIDLQARRWAVKFFVSHWHEVEMVSVLGKLPPVPYAITFLDHVHEVAPPNAPAKVLDLRVKAGRPVQSEVRTLYGLDFDVAAEILERDKASKEAA